MKKIFLLAIVSVYFNCSFGQINFNNLDKECFLIGTLNDYIGHQQTFTPRDSFYFQLVDIYYQEEKRTAFIIDSIFKTEYPDLQVKNNGAPMGIKLYSASLSKKIAPYYDYQPQGIFTVAGDTIYAGYLKENVIVTNKQKLSFLTGFFFRNRVKPDLEKYSINLPNSVRKAKLVSEFLKDLGCKDVSYEVKKEYIPVIHLISFTPSEQIVEVIKNSQMD